MVGVTVKVAVGVEVMVGVPVLVQVAVGVEVGVFVDVGVAVTMLNTSETVSPKFPASGLFIDHCWVASSPSSRPARSRTWNSTVADWGTVTPCAISTGLPSRGLLPTGTSWSPSPEFQVLVPRFLIRIIPGVSSPTTRNEGNREELYWLSLGSWVIGFGVEVGSGVKV